MNNIATILSHEYIADTIYVIFGKVMEALYQKIQIEEGSLFIAKNNITPTFDGLFHFHPEYELIFINTGNGSCLVGDKITPFKDGDLFFLGPNLPHSWRSNYNVDIDYSHSLVIQLNHDLWKGPFLSGKQLLSINKLFNQSVRGIQFHGHIRKLISQSMFDVLKESNSINGLVKILTVLDTLANWKDFDYLTSPLYQLNTKNHDFHKINMIYQYVFENFMREITLDEVAKLVHMTNSGFCRYFKKVTKSTFFSYLNEFRIGNACKLISIGDLSITEISYKSGFQSISNFNKQFKIITGFSPREYKKQIKP